jgi:hypothetical protein
LMVVEFSKVGVQPPAAASSRRHSPARAGARRSLAPPKPARTS